MSRVRLYLLGLLLLGLLGSNVAAQIYRWVDDKGTVHFTDEPPANRRGVEKVVEAGARRTPMVRGGPELRVDTPTPFFERARDRDDFYDEEYYDDGPYDAPRQGDTIIQVYEPPIWFDDDKRRHGREWKGNDKGGRHREGDRDRKHGGNDGWSRGERGRGDRGRDAPPPAVALPAPAAPPMAPPPGRSSSRARPLTR